MTIDWEALFKTKIKREKPKLKKLDICAFYTTTGYPDFKPDCTKRLYASLKCHSENKDCSSYKPAETADRRVV